MNEVMKQWERNVQPAGSSVHRGQRGQSLIIVVLAFIGILALAGLAVDLGMVYVEQVRLARAADAIVLAAVSELPVEEAAHERGMLYLRDNGYNYLDGGPVRVVINWTNSPQEEGEPEECRAVGPVDRFVAGDADQRSRCRAA